MGGPAILPRASPEDRTPIVALEGKLEPGDVNSTVLSPSGCIMLTKPNPELSAMLKCAAGIEWKFHSVAFSLGLRIGISRLSGSERHLSLPETAFPLNSFPPHYPWLRSGEGLRGVPSLELSVMTQVHLCLAAAAFWGDSSPPIGPVNSHPFRWAVFSKT